MTIEGEWIEWAGGEMPVAPLCNVDVRLRNGDVNTYAAEFCDWEHCPEDCPEFDIIAYRIVGA